MSWFRVSHKAECATRSCEQLKHQLESCRSVWKLSHIRDTDCWWKYGLPATWGSRVLLTAWQLACSQGKALRQKESECPRRKSQPFDNLILGVAYSYYILFREVSQSVQLSLQVRWLVTRAADGRRQDHWGLLRQRSRSSHRRLSTLFCLTPNPVFIRGSQQPRGFKMDRAHLSSD